MTQEVKRLVDKGQYWAAFALQQLVRVLQPGPSSAAARAKKSGPATANATPSLRDGWAAKTGPFKDVNIAEIRSLKGAPLEWLPEGMPRLAATMRLMAYADTLVEKGELVKVKHEGHFNAIYREVKTGILYRIGDVTAQELRAGLRASRVKPPIGPQIDFSRSLFVPFGPTRMGAKSTVQGPAVVAMEDLGGPTLQEALGKASPKEQKRLLGQVADVTCSHKRICSFSTAMPIRVTSFLIWLAGFA